MYMVRTPCYFRAMIVLVVAMAAAMAAAGGVALGAQQEPRQGTSTPQDSSSSVAPSSNVKPSAITDHPAIAWGYNSYGQLGNGTKTDSTTPVGVSNLDKADIKQIAGSYYHSLALESDGTVWAWGRNDYGQLGNGTIGDGTTTPYISSTPVQVDISGVTDIAVGDLYSLALKSDGTVWAWGSNYYGELGNGTTTDSPTPVQVNTSGVTVTNIASGGSHGLALKNDGTVLAWGFNSHGQLGSEITDFPAFLSTPVQVPDLSDVKDIAGGAYHSLALKSNGTVSAWGNNSSGMLGNGSLDPQSITPVQVSNLSGVTSIAAGSYHSLAIKEDTVENKKRNGRTTISVAMAWGENEWGQLGNGTTTNSNTPVQVSNLSGVKDIAGGGHHSLVLKSDGTVWAWGRNNYGQLGNGTTTDSPTPVQVPKLKRVADIDSGAHHNLAAK